MRRKRTRKYIGKNNSRKEMQSYETELNIKEKIMSEDKDHNIEYLKNAFFDSGDFGSRTITFNNQKYTILFISSLVNKEKINELVMKPMLENKEGYIPDIVTAVKVDETNDLTDAERALVKGNTVILSEKEPQMYVISVYKTEFRSIQEPTNEYVIRGTHEGFIESLETNIYLLRKRIENPNLKVEYMVLGKATNTTLAIMYLKDLADPKLVEKVKERISYIKTDSIQTPGYIEEFIEDYPWSPFPQTLNTERPDRATGNIMEGRVAILMEGSPTVLILPVTFFSFYQSPDDYNARWIVGTFLRALRLASFLIAIGLPAVYIALVSFNMEVIPIELIFSVKSSLEFIPFPPLIEAFIMQLTLELLREAAVRLPSPISQTIGIVGGLVIGTAVVQANLISNVMLIVVALTGIASFVVPSNEMTTTLRLLGFPLMILAALLGVVGIVFGLMVLLIHLCRMEPFGHPYFAPFAPFHLKDIKDTVIRLPIWMLDTRPHDARPQHYRQEWYSRRWKQDEE
ncbi:spore germination protein [Bacillus sp. Marseille-Q3570]|uniref:spore germination protein n=1 Tax=Bacillus sp. Marseille-Q3570 TaxID=2963522 RepID=UPI0021B6EB8A|nr:spore germination protein [Bacillus sp. Marseille-Q3570]